MTCSILYMISLHIFFFFFFFSSRRRHTRYIGDWSSDVCSSDLIVLEFGPENRSGQIQVRYPRLGSNRESFEAWQTVRTARSEERRVGKECRCRRETGHEKKKKGRTVEEGRVNERDESRQHIANG